MLSVRENLYTTTHQRVTMCNSKPPNHGGPHWHLTNRSEGTVHRGDQKIQRSSAGILENLVHRYGMNQLMKKLQDLQLSLLSSHAKILPKKRRKKLSN